MSRLLHERFACILLPFLLLVLIPAVVLEQNVDDLTDFDPRAFLAFGVAAAVASLLLVSTSILLERVGAGRPFSLLIELLCFFVVITGLVLPVSVSSGMRDPSQVGVHGSHLVLASLLAVVMLVISRSRHRRVLYTAVAFFVALNAASTIPALLSLSSARDSTEASIFRVSSERNIFVVSFDGVPGWAVRDVLDGSPDLARKLSSFVFFDRVASSSPATSASTAASLYGNRNFKESAETEEELWTSAPHWLLTNNLDGSGYDVSTYGIYNKELEETSRRYHTLAPRPPPSPVMLLEYALARALTRAAVPRGEAAERLGKLVERGLSPLSEEDRVFLEQVSASRSPKWKRKVETPTLLDYREYVRRLHVGSDGPTAHFLHFTYSHYPVEFDRECRFMGHDREWFDSRQDWRGVEDEAACVLTQASQFVDKLKELGVFERSLVVLKSDHGKPPRYGKPGSIEASGIRGNPMWGYGRYRPFLALKGFGPGADGVRHDQSPVLLDDLAKTVCVHSGVDVNCAAYPGFDLLGDDLGEINRSEVTMFVVLGSRADYRYDNHEAISIRRGEDVLESLRAALTRRDSGKEREGAEPY